MYKPIDVDVETWQVVKAQWTIFSGIDANNLSDKSLIDIFLKTAVRTYQRLGGQTD